MPEVDETSSIMISASSEPEPVHKPEAPAAPHLEARYYEMPEDMLLKARQLILQVFDQFEGEGQRRIAGEIKRLFDQEFRPFWHCIIGKAYASHVSHGKKNNSIHSLTAFQRKIDSCMLTTWTTQL